MLLILDPHRSCDIGIKRVFSTRPYLFFLPCSNFAYLYGGGLTLLSIISQLVEVNLALLSSCSSSLNNFPCKANHISSYLLLSPMMAAAAIWNAVATPKNLPKLTLPFLMESKYHGFHMDTRPPEGQFFLLLPHLGILWDPRMAVKGVSNHPTNILSLIPLWS